MTKLVTMYGRKPDKPFQDMGKNLGAPQYQFSLFSMSGNSQDDPILNTDLSKLSNIDAGIVTLYAIAKRYPRITFGDLFFASSRLGWNPFDKTANFVRDTVSFTSRNTGDLLNWGGDKAGDAIRLLTDKEVVGGLSQYAAAYASGGASAGITGMLQNLGIGEGGENFLADFLGKLGMNTKNQTGTIAGIQPIYFISAAGVLLLVLILK